MSKCGKGCMPECEYFITGGCVSPFNCPHRIEEISPNSATSISDAFMQGLIAETHIVTVGDVIDKFADKVLEKIKYEYENYPNAMTVGTYHQLRKEINAIVAEMRQEVNNDNKN